LGALGKVSVSGASSVEVDTHFFDGVCAGTAAMLETLGKACSAWFHAFNFVHCWFGKFAKFGAYFFGQRRVDAGQEAQVFF
jgi:hypothetical protein